MTLSIDGNEECAERTSRKVPTYIFIGHDAHAADDAAPKTSALDASSDQDAE